MSLPSPSPLLDSSKQTFVTRDLALPLDDQLQLTRGDLYDLQHTLTARDDRVLELLQGYNPRLTDLETRLTNLESSMETQHEQLGGLTSLCHRILQHLETAQAPPQLSTAPENQNGT
ncbi:hypothetical protein HOY80DRAFT_1028759 [Tuber brumale]|nr:hypothetical protein HOY80DRAFT_1028759 [Tuber brumale]